VWLSPAQSLAVVAVDVRNGTVYTSWPPGFVKNTSVRFQLGGFDGVLRSVVDGHGTAMLFPFAFEGQ
jgi:hypothetical protein